MAQSDDMAAINGYMKGAQAKTALTTEMQQSFIQWYANLSWYDKNMSKPTYDEARRRRAAFNEAQGTPEAATGMTTEQMQQTPTTPSVAAPISPAPSGGKPGLKPGSRPTIRRGSSGPAVIEWQHVLGTNADGKFGPGTEGLTKSWQRQHNLKDDGIVGPLTWAAASAKPGQATVKVAQVTDGTKKVTTVTKTSQPQQVKSADGKTKTVVKTTTVKTSEPAKKTTVASKTKEAISKVKESSIYGSIADAPWWQKLLGVSVIGGTAWYFGRNPEKHTTKYE